MFIGRPSESDFSISKSVEDAIKRGLRVQWINKVDDSTFMNTCSMLMHLSPWEWKAMAYLQSLAGKILWIPVRDPV